MSDMMTFPDTWEEFEKFYGFNDSEEIYTNNSRLIPSFRVKQWLDYIDQHEIKQQATVSSDLISRQAAINACIRVREHHAYDEIEEIKALPSAEPQIIRCKDCRWWTNQSTTLQGKCRLHNLNPMPEWYCASGEVGVDIKDGFTKWAKSVADSYRSQQEVKE